MQLTSEHFESADITVWQPAKGHRYGEESIALAEFANVAENAKVAELGSGVGLISLLVAARREPSLVAAVEIQELFHEIAERNVSENRFSGIVHCINEDFRKFANASEGTFDCVVANPPFYRANEGRLSPDPARAIARHELNGTIEDLVRAAHKLLKPDGKFFVVFDARRGEELKDAARRTGFSVARIEEPHCSAYLLIEFTPESTL